MRRPGEWHFSVSAVDQAGVPWDVAYTRDPIAALDVQERYAALHPGVHVYAMDDDAVDLDAHYIIDDTDDPLVEKWLNEQPDSTLIAICAVRHGVSFYDGTYSGSGEWLDRGFVIDFILCEGKVAA